VDQICEIAPLGHDWSEDGALPGPEDTLERLRRALAAGRWRPGDRLPPERSLAREFGVARSTLRAALEALAREGLIWRHVGQGTFVCGLEPEGVVANLRLDPPPSPADVLELRLMIEPDIAAVAALRATARDIARLRALLGEGTAAGDWAAWEEVDTRFHTALAAASRNPLLVGVLETLNVIRGRREWSLRRASTLTEAWRALYADQHRALVDAVAGRDPQAAAEAMRRHLKSVQRAMSGDAADPALFALAPDTHPTGETHAG